MEGKQSSATPPARGRGRGRAATTTSRAWRERMAGLVEKAREDMGREDVAVAMVYSLADEIGGRGYWPSNKDAKEVAKLYFGLPLAERIMEDQASYATGLLDAQRSKLDKVRQDGIASALGPWERDLDGKPLEALQELFASIEVSQKAAQSRIRQRQTHPDESVAGDKDASDEVQGTQKQPHGADEVQETQMQPHGADEVPGTQNQPPGDDDFAAWMEQLVEDLEEKPESPSGSAAPYHPSPHEYINVGGGHEMEEDAYHYMRYDRTMFTPYYGQTPRQLPWDNSSTPGGAPPPPPPPSQ